MCERVRKFLTRTCGSISPGSCGITPVQQCSGPCGAAPPDIVTAPSHGRTFFEPSPLKNSPRLGLMGRMSQVKQAAHRTPWKRRRPSLQKEPAAWSSIRGTKGLWQRSCLRRQLCWTQLRARIRTCGCSLQRQRWSVRHC